VAKKNGKQVTDATHSRLFRSFRLLLDLNSTDRFDAKPDRRINDKHDKKCQNNGVRGPNWLLGLCRSKRADKRSSVL